jgi:hypothetical protein
VSRANGNVTTGTMTYSDGVRSLLTGGNKVTTTGNSRNWRILGTPVTLDANNPEVWVSFLGRANSTGTGHVGVALANGSEAATAEIVTLGKGASTPNWGLAGVTHGTDAYSSTPATTQALLVYQFVYGSGGTATAKLWVNPSLGGTPTGTPSATTTLSNFSFDRVRVSSGSGNFGDLDEIRIGTSFSKVAPVAGGSFAAGSMSSVAAQPQQKTSRLQGATLTGSNSMNRLASRFSSTPLWRELSLDGTE